jgi:ribosomal protein L30E
MKITMLLMILGLVSCSPRQIGESKQDKVKTNTEIENLIIFEDMNTDLQADGSAVLKSKLGDILPSTVLPLDIEVDDQGQQIIRLQSKERRASIDMTISEGTPPAGISTSHNCPAQLKRRQSCYMTIDIDASAIGEGSLASHQITINNETYTVQYNVIASTKLTPVQEAEGLIELSPSEASPVAFGTLEKTEGEKDSQTIQLRNKSRKSLPVVIDQAGLSSVSMTTTCQASLDRGRACLVFLSLDSSSLSAGSISESIVISGKTYSITGNINERSQAEIEAFEQTIADNAIILNPLTSIDLGQVKQGRTKIASIQITNQSRDEVSLNIDGSSLSEFSMGSCPAILGKRRSCYLSITYDATSASIGAKSESLTIGSTSYTVNAEVISGGEEQPEPAGILYLESATGNEEIGNKLPANGVTNASFTESNIAVSSYMLRGELDLSAPIFYNTDEYISIAGIYYKDTISSSCHMVMHKHPTGSYRGFRILDENEVPINGKSNCIDIAKQVYKFQGNMIETPATNNAIYLTPEASGCSTTYDGSLASYFGQFPEPANFVEALACEDLVVSMEKVIFPGTSTVVPQFNAGEGIYQIDSVSYTGLNGKCSISGRTAGNSSRQYYQRDYISENGCLQIAKDMVTELDKNDVMTAGTCTYWSGTPIESADQWIVDFFNKAEMIDTSSCESIASVSPTANKCSNSLDASSCASAHGGTCYWDSVNSYCLDTANFSCSSINAYSGNTEGLCNASGCTYISCDEGSGECDNDPDYQMYMVTDQCVGVNSATACSERSMMTMDEFECTGSQYRGNNCYWNMDISMCEDEQTPDPVCENNTQEGSCISSSGGCMWNAGICEAPVANSCMDYMNETQCMDDIQAFGICSWDGTSCQESIGGTCSGPDPVNDETCELIMGPGWYHDGNVCTDVCP